MPFLSALAMLGYGLAGAVSPYLGVVLRNEDPRLPFVISGVVLLLTTLALSKVERDVAAQAPAPSADGCPGQTAQHDADVLHCVDGDSLARLPTAFQPQQRVVLSALHDAGSLQWLLPVFWIGFNIAMFPASVVVKHRGGLIVMGAAGLLGALAVLGAEMSGNLHILIVAQFLAGAAWGCMLMSAVSAALAIGETGAEGKVIGLVFSALALATFARMAAVAGGLQKLPEYAPCCNGRRWPAGRSPARACW